MQNTFIKATAALSAAGLSATALAGGGGTYDVGFSDAPYYSIANGGIDAASPNYNGSTVMADA
ncbi:MAG: hypothetical protein GY895_05945, partial [Phycisphaera sp.]|nr:hypothetical protein [Phycisphaera sp.]